MACDSICAGYARHMPIACILDHSYWNNLIHMNEHRVLKLAPPWNKIVPMRVLLSPPFHSSRSISIPRDQKRNTGTSFLLFFFFFFLDGCGSLKDALRALHADSGPFHIYTWKVCSLPVHRVFEGLSRYPRPTVNLEGLSRYPRRAHVRT